MFEATKDIAWAEQLPQTFTSQDVEDIKAEIDIPRANVTILNTVYSPEETKIGVWREYRTVEGQQVLMQKPYYERVINCGTMPDSTTKTIAHNISNIDTIKKICGTYIHPGGTTYPLPSMVTNDPSYSGGVYVDKTNIVIITARNISAYSAELTLGYTLTTDEWEVI